MYTYLHPLNRKDMLHFQHRYDEVTSRCHGTNGSPCDHQNTCEGWFTPKKSEMVLPDLFILILRTSTGLYLTKWDDQPGIFLHFFIHSNHSATREWIVDSSFVWICPTSGTWKYFESRQIKIRAPFPTKCTIRHRSPITNGPNHPNHWG